MVSDNKVLAIINEFKGINEIELGNLTYVYSKLGELDEDFELDFYGLRSLSIESAVKSLASRGLVKNNAESFRTFRLTSEGHKEIDASTQQKIQDIGRRIKNLEDISLFELAIYYKMKEVYPLDKVPEKARNQGITEDKITQIEKTFSI